MLPAALCPLPRLASCVDRGGGPRARQQADGDVGGVVGEVVGVVAAAVPHRHEDLVAERRALGDAVDRHGAGGRAPSVDRVAAVGGVVGAVLHLQRRDVVHHQRLRVAIRGVCVAARRRPDVRLVAHHRIFERVVVGGHCGERAARLVGMLQPHRVAGLVDDRDPRVVPHHRVVVPAGGIVEPRVAAGRRRAGVVRPSGAGPVGHRVAQVAVLQC